MIRLDTVEPASRDAYLAIELSDGGPEDLEEPILSGRRADDVVWGDAGLPGVDTLAPDYP